MRTEEIRDLSNSLVYQPSRGQLVEEKNQERLRQQLLRAGEAPGSASRTREAITFLNSIGPLREPAGKQGEDTTD
ncbi:hypothetical protein ACFL0Y_00865 [Patescibacteria group bacterium]